MLHAFWIFMGGLCVQVTYHVLSCIFQHVYFTTGSATVRLQADVRSAPFPLHQALLKGGTCIIDTCALLNHIQILLPHRVHRS